MIYGHCHCNLERHFFFNVWVDSCFFHGWEITGVTADFSQLVRAAFILEMFSAGFQSHQRIKRTLLSDKCGHHLAWNDRVLKISTFFTIGTRLCRPPNFKMEPEQKNWFPRLIHLHFLLAHFQKETTPAILQPVSMSASKMWVSGPTFSSGRRCLHSGACFFTTRPPATGAKVAIRINRGHGSKGAKFHRDQTTKAHQKWEFSSWILPKMTSLRFRKSWCFAQIFLGDTSFWHRFLIS